MGKISAYAAADPVALTDQLIGVVGGVSKSVTFAVAGREGPTGVAAQAMADANQEPAIAIRKYHVIQTTGAITANKNLTLPTATDAVAYLRLIENLCTGAYAIVITTGAGTTVTLPNGYRCLVLVDSRGITQMSPATSLLGGGIALVSGANQVSGIGLLRVPYVADTTFVVIGTKGSAGADKSVIRCGTDTTKFGDTIGSTKVDGADISLLNAGNMQVYLDGTIVGATKPIVGYGSNPYGVHGTVPTVALTAAQNLTLSAAQYALDTIKVSTAAGGACTVTYPAGTDAASFKKYVWHVSGTGTVAVSNGTVTIAAALSAGQGAWFEFSVAGVAQLTPAFTVLVGA